MAADRACGAALPGPLGACHTDYDILGLSSSRRCWAEIDQEASDYALEVLPPHYGSGYFQVSEAVCSDDQRRTLYLTVVGTGGRCFASHQPIGVPAAQAAAELRAFVAKGGAQ
jgi:hypothetical protein